MSSGRDEKTMTESRKYDKIIMLTIPEFFCLKERSGRTEKGKQNEAEDRAVPGFEEAAADVG